MTEFQAAFEAYGLAAVCLVMLAKAAGIPLPVPGDLIVLAAAAQVGQGKLSLWPTFVGLLCAVVGGGTLQFGVARGPARGLVYRVARFAGLGRERLDGAAQALRRRGPLSLSVALLTPGVRNLAVPACGLAGTSPRVFVPALAVASGLDLALHFVLGAFGGSLLEAVRPDPLAVGIAVVVLALMSLAAWLILARRRRVSALAAWEAAGCPACVALGALAERSPDTAYAAAALTQA